MSVRYLKRAKGTGTLCSNLMDHSAFDAYGAIGVGPGHLLNYIEMASKSGSKSGLEIHFQSQKQRSKTASSYMSVKRHKR